MITVIFIFAVLRTAYGLTSSDLTTLDSAVREVVPGNVALLVRLAFHDCVGGCDGCLNVDNPSNAGLEPLVEDLDAVYVANSLDTLVSRADFWAYAGQFALARAITNTNLACDTADANCPVPDLNISFQTGRVDCSTAPYTDVDVGLPSSHIPYANLTAFYADNFGLTEEESVAIMGAHTLGGAEVDNSGFSGVWVRGGAQLFNNDYYTLLLDDTWRQRDVSDDATDPRWQWNAAGVGMMLNADMCLIKEVELDDDGESSCSYDDCAASDGASIVQNFAASQDDWLDKFASAFTKMQATGDFVLSDVE